MFSNSSLSDRELQTLKIIRTWLMNKGVMPSIRELMAEMEYKSPRSVAELIESLVEKKFLKKKTDGSLIMVRDTERPDRASTVDIPILGNVACGLPIFAEQNIEGYVPVSVEMVRGPNKYFILKACGNSMNLAGIDDGDLVLVRQQQTANDGEIVVALIDDEATIKKLSKQRDAIVLKPLSSSPEYKPIILNRDFLIQGVVVTTIRMNED